MQRSKSQTNRNKIDLSDPSQVRSLKKRFGISAGELHHAIGKVGNSIAALSKELQKATPATAPVQAASALEGWNDGGGLVPFVALETISRK